ncbi:TPA: recombinase family protein [Bacillus cereus]
MKRTVAYYRSSTTLQENSIVMQRSKVVHYSVQKKLPIHEEYTDEYVSSRKVALLDRPNMARLIQDIKEGTIERILVYKRDRLARNLNEHLELYKLFKEYNIEVCFASENEIPMTYTAIGEYLECILGAMNEHEGKQIAERIMETRIANFISGKSSGNVPFGYKTKKRDNSSTFIERIEPELKIVREIYEAILSDKYKTLQELYRDFNAQGKLKRKTSWHQQLILETVSNPLYMGTQKMNSNNQSIPRYLTELSIVNEEEWNEANDKILGMLVKRKPNVAKFRFPLKEILQCYECRKDLDTNERMRNGKKYKVYECKEHNVFVVADSIEKDIIRHGKEFFTKMLRSDFEKLYKRSQQKSVEQLQKWIKEQERIVSNQEIQLARKIDRWLKNESVHHKKEMDLTYDELKEEKNRLVKLQKRLYEIKHIKEQAQQWCNDLKYENIILELSEEKRKEFYRDIIEVIYISDYEYHIIFKHPFMMVQEVYCEPENNLSTS